MSGVVRPVELRAPRRSLRTVDLPAAHAVTPGDRAAGFLVPARPAMIRRHGGTVELTDFFEGRAYRADGRFGEAILSFFAAGTRDPALLALGSDHPLGRFLDAVSGAPVLPLEPAAIVALGGFDTLFVELVGRCNERCVHCYAASSPDVAGALERELAMGIIDDAAELGVQRVQLTGGDPLLCSFLPELVAHARERGVPQLEIYTNGLALNDRLIDRLAPHRPDFAFSFYSCDPARHDAITGTPGSQRRTVAAIERALARGLKVRVSMIVMAENAQDQEATIAFLRDLGVESIHVTGSYAVGRGDRFDGEVAAVGNRAHRGGDGEAPAPGRGSLCVTYDGEVVPCIFNRQDVLGRIRERRLIDIARDPALPPRRLATSEQLIEECRSRLSCGSCQLTAVALQLAPRGGER